MRRHSITSKSKASIWGSQRLSCPKNKVIFKR